jgi:glycosyltransferase involved in cell wall biosynthesis
MSAHRTDSARSASGAERQARLLMVVNDAGFFLSHRLPVALAARAAGWEVHLATPAGVAVEAIRRHGFPHHPVPISRGGLGPCGELRTVVALCRLYRTLRPDLAHHITIKPVLYGGIAARLTGVPAVVAAVSGLGYVFSSPSWRARLLRRPVRGLYRIALRHPNSHVIVQNPADRETLLLLRAVEAANLTIVRGSGVDLERFRPSPEAAGKPIVLMAARMLHEKGVGVFVECARLLRQRSCAVRCVLAGAPDPGNPSSLSEAELQALHRAGDVEWWGQRDDMEAVLSQARIVSLPSYYGEGMPKVLLEAAASGRAIVTTDVPGCRDVVEHGGNGLLVPPRDPVALADAIQTLLENPTLRRRLAESGRKRAEAEFSERSVVQAHLQIYADLARGRAAVG